VNTKLLLLKVECINLELQDVKDELIKYQKKFSIDFKDEIFFLQKEKKQIKQKINLDESFNQITRDAATKKFIKKSYHKLAKKIHPDIQPDKKISSDFKIASEAHKKGDTLKIIELINKHDIEIETTLPEFITHIEELMMLKQNNITQMKNSLEWKWGHTQNKNEEFRKKIQQAIGIDLKKFNEWLKNMNE
jgi:hypothetical protein